MKTKTMNQVKKEFIERIENAYTKALANTKDEVEAAIILSAKERVAKPKKVSLKEIRYSLDIIETMAEREM